MLNLAQIYKFLAARYDRLERRAVIVDRSRSIFTTPCVLNPNLIDAIFFFFFKKILNAFERKRHDLGLVYFYTKYSISR